MNAGIMAIAGRKPLDSGEMSSSAEANHQDVKGALTDAEEPLKEGSKD